MRHHVLWNTYRPLLILILVISLVFLFQLWVGRDSYYPFMAVPGSIADSWRDLRNGNFSLLQDGWEFATLLSCVFLHADGQHLLFNMLYLWMFAALALELLGVRWMFLLFFVTGICGSLCHTLFNATEYIPSLGASGAVMGFQGAYLAMVVRWRLPDPQAWPLSRPIAPSNLALFALIGIATDYYGLMDHSSSGIAYGAHIGGFISGVFLTGFLAPRPAVAHPR